MGSSPPAQSNPCLAKLSALLFAPHAPQAHATNRVALLRNAQSVPTKRACAPMLQSAVAPRVASRHADCLARSVGAGGPLRALAC